jgi:hypothetical protein
MSVLANITNHIDYNYNLLCLEYLKDMKYVLAYPDSKNINTKFYKVDSSIHKTPWNKEFLNKVNEFKVDGIRLGGLVDLNGLKFHTNWSLIMNIVTKILNNKIDFNYTNLENALKRADKELIVKEINTFLKYYFTVTK